MRAHPCTLALLSARRPSTSAEPPDLVLHREEGAAGVHEVHARQVVLARDLLRAHDGVSGPCSRRPKCRRLSALRVLQDRDGRLTFHELEACLLKGSTVVKQGGGGQKSEVVTRVRSAATLLAPTLASSLSKPLTL